MPDDDLERWNSSVAVGLEFGAPVLSHEQVLHVLERDGKGLREYLRLLADSYDRPQLLQFVDALCAALLTVAQERRGAGRRDG